MVWGNTTARCRPLDASRVHDRAVDAGLAAVLFVAPLAMGGRHPAGLLLFVALVGITATAWVAGQCWRRDARWTTSGAEWLICAGLLLLALQLTPLPAWLLARLSLATPEFLPLWTSGTSAAGGGLALGSWHTISLTPHATRISLVAFLAYAILFLVAVQRIRTLADVERILRWTATAAVAVAVLGLAQFLVGNGKFLWVYAHPSRDTLHAVKAMFANENHCAHLLALGIPALIWSLARWPKRLRAQARSTSLAGLLGTALAVTVFAGMLTFSRGGLIVIVLAAATMIGLLACKQAIDRRVWLLLAGGGLLAGAALLVHGYEPLRGEVETLASLDKLDAHGGRQKLWRAEFLAFQQAPIVGVGVGSCREVYPAFFPDYSNVYFSHGESAFVQVLMESGVLGLALLLAGLALAGRWCSLALRGLDGSAYVASAAATAGLVVSVVHSAWDFVWYLPACMTVALLLLACVFRLSRLAMAVERAPCERTPCERAPRERARRASADRVRRERARLAWGLAAGATAIVCGSLVQAAWAPAWAAPAWERYVGLTKTSPSLQDVADAEAQAPRMLEHLHEAARRDPHNARVHMKLAALHLIQFEIEQREAEVPLTLATLRDASIQSEFGSREAFESWLTKVAGDQRARLYAARRHARAAVELCPLLGEAYIVLSDVAFLEGRGEDARQTLLDQARRVRPHSGDVLYAAGRQALERGDVDTALAAWQATFAHDPTYRPRMIAMLAPHVSATRLFESLRPDHNGMLQMYRHYQRAGNEAAALEIAEPLAAALEHAARTAGPDAGRLWAEAHYAHVQLGDEASALRCVRRALAETPDKYDLHHSCATRCLRLGEHDEALRHLVWCLRRKPGDAALQAEIARVRKSGLTAAADRQQASRR